MKYTLIDVEKPPLGEMIVAKSDSGTLSIGSFHENNGNRYFRDEVVVKYPNPTFYGTGLITLKDPIKWAKMPQMIDINTMKPKFGRCIIVRIKYETIVSNFSFQKVSLIKDQFSSEVSDKITHWICASELEEDI